MSKQMRPLAGWCEASPPETPANNIANRAGGTKAHVRSTRSNKYEATRWLLKKARPLA